MTHVVTLEDIACDWNDKICTPGVRAVVSMHKAAGIASAI